MFRRRLVLVLVLAAAMGTLTGFFVYRAVKTAGGQGAPTEEILVADVNVTVGEALTSKHVKLAAWPKTAVPSGSLRAVKDAEGRVARASMVIGEPVLDAKLAPAGQAGLMPVLVPTGKRAVTIKVDEAVQKSGFVVPNSRVDVLVTMARKLGEAKETRIVLQDVLVLASDQTVEMKDNKPVTMTTVTMAITPEETERLALAQNEGRVTLALRNLNDNRVVSTAGVTTAQLLGSPAPAPRSPGAAKPVAKLRSRGAGTAQGARPVQPAAPAAARVEAPAPAHSTVPAAMQVQGPAPAQTVSAAPVETVSVSVIRGTSETEYRFVKDPNRGWAEAPREERSK